MTMRGKVTLVSFHSLRLKSRQRPALRRPRKHPGSSCREGEQEEQGWEAAPDAGLSSRPLEAYKASGGAGWFC